MWLPEHRRAACVRGLRYPSDLTDAEWALVEPLIPPAKRGGRRRTIDVREVLNAIFYVLSTGRQRNALPSDLPPKSTVYDHLDLWDWDASSRSISKTLCSAQRATRIRSGSPLGRVQQCLTIATWVPQVPAAGPTVSPSRIPSSRGPHPNAASGYVAI